MKYAQKLKEIYKYRYILKSLITKNLIGRYKNSVFGFAWHFFTPLLLMLIYYIVFVSVKQNNLPDFWIYLASGLFPFTFMLSCIVGSTNLIVSSGGMIKKMDFPKEIIVISYVLSNFIILLIGYTVVLLSSVIYGFDLHTTVFWIPFEMLITFIFSLGTSLLFSSITVYVRDIHFLMNSISIMFYMLTPMYFTIGDITGILSIIVWYNPLTYFVESYHDLFYFGIMPNLPISLISIFISILTLIVGVIVFDKLKGKFAEKL